MLFFYQLQCDEVMGIISRAPGSVFFPFAWLGSMEMSPSAAGIGTEENSEQLLCTLVPFKVYCRQGLETAKR